MATGSPTESVGRRPKRERARVAPGGGASKLVASGLCRLLSGFPLFSEAIQVAYSNPERTLSRKRPPRCPSSKPSSMGGRSRKNDIIDHPSSLTLPPGCYLCYPLLAQDLGQLTDIYQSSCTPERRRKLPPSFRPRKWPPNATHISRHPLRCLQLCRLLSGRLKLEHLAKS